VIISIDVGPVERFAGAVDLVVFDAVVFLAGAFFFSTAHTGAQEAPRSIER
jgi:hypothetical protein